MQSLKKIHAWAQVQVPLFNTSADPDQTASEEAV